MRDRLTRFCNPFNFAALVLVIALLALATGQQASTQTVVRNPSAIQALDTNGQARFAVAPLNCDSSVAVNITSATTTQLVALTASRRVYVCGASLHLVGNATPVTAKFVYGTGASCGTGTTDLTGAFTGSTTAGNTVLIDMDLGVGTWFRTGSGTALCVTSTGTAGVQGFVTYTQF